MKRVIFAIAVIAGVGITIRDYRQWVHAETDKYGQGYVDTRAPAQELPNLYENKWAGIRIRFPAGWQVVEERQSKFVGDNFENQTAAGEQIEIAKWGDVMAINVEKTNGNLIDIVNAEIGVIKKNGRMLREGEVLQLETAGDGRLLTWETGTALNNETVYQEAIFENGDKTVRIVCKTAKTNWSNWEKTWLEIFKSLVVI